MSSKTFYVTLNKTIHQSTKMPQHWSGILTDIRKESGLTRVRLAELSGVGVTTIENYEKSKIDEPSIYKVEALLKAMGYELDAVQP